MKYKNYKYKLTNEEISQVIKFKKENNKFNKYSNEEVLEATGYLYWKYKNPQYKHLEWAPISLYEAFKKSPEQINCIYPNIPPFIWFM